MGQDRGEECCVREERVFLEFLWSRRCSCRCGRCEACFQSFNGGHPRVAEHCIARIEIAKSTVNRKEMSMAEREE